ncbi:unnamed protein product [Leptidea sinapis]|uniref:Uncharacterized protein n=1 Tax=Leptidea sinapis TaxID=189913 RepID=A0A5E4QFA6_9NEOP|nr:unnamed protein product [Leptidea sinapis]
MNSSDFIQCPTTFPAVRLSGTSIKMYSSKVPQFETLAVSVPKKYVYHVEMNRPQQINTFTPVMWRGLQHVMEIAETIAKKSPIAVQNTKISLVYSQSRPNKQGLEHISLINQISLQSEDLKKAAIAQATKTETEFDLH